MNALHPAWPIAATLALLALHEAARALSSRRHPERQARAVNARLRDDWLQAVSAERGSEVLAVQTLRNALMSATLTASTAALGLMATATLAATALRATQATGEPATALPPLTQGLLAAGVLGLLLVALVSSTLAVRGYQHASFVCGMPVQDSRRERWLPLGRHYLRQAGWHYSRGLRALMLLGPLLAAVLHPWAGPPTALGLLWALRLFDRPGPQALSAP
jgi:hypothetical protein